ncbi:MAG: class I SAM-dependent methyltransferase, partial [Verrucomicrobiota bacterium]
MRQCHMTSGLTDDVRGHCCERDIVVHNQAGKVLCGFAAHNFVAAVYRNPRLLQAAADGGQQFGQRERRYGAVVGLDYSADAARLGAGRIPGMFAQGSVLALPFADASFDLVTSFDVLYHRAVPSEATALAEARRVLRPGGGRLMRLP